jgi:predicted RNase H-like HicB family nuclease
MHNEFTAVFERDGDWYIACSPEIPGANGQGRAKDEARQSLAAAIALIKDATKTRRHLVHVEEARTDRLIPWSCESF